MLPSLISSSSPPPPSSSSPQNFDYFQSRVQVEKILMDEKDRRMRFFLRYGLVRRFDLPATVFVELPQIPKKIVVYRRQGGKKEEKMNLNCHDLPHIPLFEGEDELKFLSLEQNKIEKIDPFVSLNNLVYINLYNNKISEIENLFNIPKLRVLLLGKNNLKIIRNLEYVSELEILDLHSNKIKEIGQGLICLSKLRILNLANNLLTSFRELANNKLLEELNIRKNFIERIGTLPAESFYNIKKINIGKNILKDIKDLKSFLSFPNLEEIILEQNPVMYNPEAKNILNILPLKVVQNIKKNVTDSFLRVVRNSKKMYMSTNLSAGRFTIKKEKIKNFTIPYISSYFNKNRGSAKEIGKVKETPDEAKKTEDLNTIEATYLYTKNELYEKVTPIRNLWENEYKNIIIKGYNGYVYKKYREINIDQGHVEIVKENELLLYGNCLKILTYEELHSLITTLSFTYFCYDFILSRRILSYIQKFKGLKCIKFSFNNIYSFYQITKLENIQGLEDIHINYNEINNAYLLNSFLLYRLNGLKKINGKIVNEKERHNARKIYNTFDKAISIKELEEEKKCNNHFIINKIKYKNIEIQNNQIKNEYFNYIKYNLESVINNIINEDIELE